MLYMFQAVIRGINNKTINKSERQQDEIKFHFLKDIPVQRQMNSGFPFLNFRQRDSPQLWNL